MGVGLASPLLLGRDPCWVKQFSGRFSVAALVGADIMRMGNKTCMNVSISFCTLDCAVVLGLELAFQVDMRGTLFVIVCVIVCLVSFVGMRSRPWIEICVPS